MPGQFDHIIYQVKDVTDMNAVDAQSLPTFQD